MSTDFLKALERTDGKTLILSNGSKWAGDTPDNIQTLLDVLSKEVLDPRFEQYHCYRPYSFSPEVRVKEPADYLIPWIDAKTFFGNFLTRSHVFNIITVDPEVIGKMETAIQKNMESDEYQKEAYKQYADWYYAENDDGFLLVSPQEAADIINGTVTKARYSTRYQTLVTARVNGPRFDKKLSAGRSAA